MDIKEVIKCMNCGKYVSVKYLECNETRETCEYWARCKKRHEPRKTTSLCDCGMLVWSDGCAKYPMRVRRWIPPSEYKQHYKLEKDALTQGFKMAK